MKQKFVLTPKEAAKILGVGENKIYQLVKTEGFPKLMIGKMYRIPMLEFEQWVKDNITVTKGGY